MSTRPSPRDRFGDPIALVRRLRHHRRSRPVLAAALVALSLWALRADHDATRAVRAEWGEGTTVWVAATPVDAGQVLSDADVRPLRLPPIALPTDAVLDNPAGRRVVATVATGEILRSARLDESGAGPVASLVGPDRGALTLSGAAPHVQPGDLVDLYALLDGAVLATGAEVVELVDGVPVVAMAQRDLAGVIQAMSFGDVVPVLVG